ncbi:acyl-CoA-binding domain-containing protein 4 isoform X2 [Bacillus rossius redtenbacheri]|uniref:acyl-CoA-binding domain-containing protein 4 isoform X2 n=1 Tax=Bacillus rossius redtenbacheri TaxID=93214 RepID=UPI002FDCFF87
MTTEEKFNAAVNVIRNLPKNGSYQPAHDLQLRFYAYYKQATEGPCVAPRPGFWEVIKKVKWEAWNRLGNMSREEAMNNYVEELKKIVETMSYTDNVADFLGSLGSFYDHVPMQDLELLIGNVIERVRSQPGSPVCSRDTSPVRRAFSSLDVSPASSYSASPLPPAPGPDEEDEEDEEFIDTVEAEPERLRKDSTGKRAVQHAHTNGVAAAPREREAHKPPALVSGRAEPEDQERGRPRHASPSRGRVPGQDAPSLSPGISEKIRDTVLHLQRDLDRVTARVRSLEVSALSGPSLAPAQSLQHGRVGQPAGLCVPQRRQPGWWPLAELSVPTAVFVLGWPLALHLLATWLARRRRQP